MIRKRVITASGTAAVAIVASASAVQATGPVGRAAVDIFAPRGAPCLLVQR